MTAQPVRVVHDWCRYGLHPVYATVPRVGTPDADEAMEINCESPMPCVEIAGVSVCIICLQFIEQALVPAFARWCEDSWQALDTHIALETAEELTK